jgi:hypothetical protein
LMANEVRNAFDDIENWGRLCALGECRGHDILQAWIKYP